MTDITAFTQLLDQQLKQVTQLELLLLEEKDVLQKLDHQALSQLVESKQTVLTAIETLDQAIKQAALYQEFIAETAVADMILAIENKLSDCKDLNDVNGAIIQQSDLAIERMKSALLQSRSKSSMTYDNKGKTTGGTLSKGIKA